MHTCARYTKNMSLLLYNKLNWTRFKINFIPVSLICWNSNFDPYHTMFFKLPCTYMYLRSIRHNLKVKMKVMEVHNSFFPNCAIGNHGTVKDTLLVIICIFYGKLSKFSKFHIWISMSHFFLLKQVITK